MATPGIITNETVSLIEACAPIDANDGAQTGNMISMKGATHCTLVLMVGTCGAASAVTLEQATDVTDSAASSKALAFSWMWTNDAAPTAAALTKTAVTANTFEIDVAASMYVIEISADMLDVDNGYDCFQVKIADPGAASVTSGTYILSGTRFSGDNTPLSN